MAGSDADATTVALTEEQLHVSKREVETGRVRVRTVVDEHDLMVEDVLRRQTASVERIAVEREVGEAPAPRQEGDVLVLSIVEERLVVRKTLVVVEEIRVRSQATDETVTLPATVRKMRAVVERVDETPSTTGTN